MRKIDCYLQYLFIYGKILLCILFDLKMLKKIFLFILLFFSFISLSFWDSSNTTVNWNYNNVDCSTSTSHWVIHPWVPNTNNSNVSTNWWRPCKTHAYYSADDHWVPMFWTTITSCPTGQMAVSMFWWQIQCREYDDKAPVNVTISYTSGWTNTWVFITMTARDIIDSLDPNTGYSKLKKIELYESSKTHAWTWSSYNLLWSATWDNIDSTLLETRTWTRTAVWWMDYRYRVRAYDYAWNYTEVTNAWVISFDLIDPDSLSINYTSGWTNSNQTINVQAQDSWWSNIEYVELQQSTNSWAYLAWHTWNSLNLSSFNQNRTRTLVNWNDYRYRLIVRDEAWNESILENPNLIRFDNITPTIADIWDTSPPNNSPLLATNSQNFTVIVDRNWSTMYNWGAPISDITAYFEDYASIDSYLSVAYNWSSPFSISPSIEDVDNDRESDWYRNYRYKITRVCDEAWNCIQSWNNSSNVAWLKNYDFDVYANTTNLWVREVDIADKNNLEDADNVADGSITYPVRINLLDIYWNQVVPWPLISRTISFDFDVLNNLLLNQYRRTWWPWVFSTTTLDSTFRNNRFLVWWASQINTFSDQTSSDWIYQFDFKVYSPTYQDPLIDPSAQFSINNITTDIAWIIWNVSLVDINNDVIDFNFSPLYKANISWELKTIWIIEWAEQSSWINITKSIWWVDLTSRNLYITYWSWLTNEVSPWFNLYFDQADASSWSLAIEWNSFLLSSSTPLEIDSWFSTLPNSVNFKTIVVKEPSAIVYDIQNSYIATHIWYEFTRPDTGLLDSVVYNYDIVWKSNYWDSSLWSDNTNVVWLKVLWRTSSDSYKNLVSNQDERDIHILWDLSKTTLMYSLIKNTYEKIKLVPLNNWLRLIDDLTSGIWLNSNWTIFDEDKLLYFWNLNWNIVSLWNWTTLEIEWNKTLIVVGWNLYIKNNMYYNDKDNDILWIIVLKDENGNWWNLYIDPSVTNIVWSIFTEWSLISYNWVELWYSTSFDTLKNQLHIYGSVFSQNTIWGSRSSPPICPYFVNAPLVCDVELAQKYDLNYLRRYFLYTNPSWYRVPADTWNLPVTRTIWWGYSTWTWWIFWYDSNLNRIITNTSDTYAAYPVVIEYNPLIQISPPPLFYK